MNIVSLPTTGNSAKFTVTTKRGDFVIALSRTLKSIIWELPDAEAELAAATELAEAIVSRHDPALPFKKIYIFAEHNTAPTLEQAVKQIRKYGYEGQTHEKA